MMSISLKILVLLCALLLSNVGFAEVSCDIAYSVLNQVQTIRGLRKKKAVECEVRNRDDIRKFVVDAIKTKIPAEKIRNEEIIYKALGILPEELNYKETLVDLYVSQIGGYYDPAEKHYVMAAWLPEMVQPGVAAHELTHALQDQYFDLEKMMEQETLPTDVLMARQALVEGDATAVMLDYSLAPLRKSIRSESNVDAYVMQNVIGMGMASGLQNVPEALKMLMLFPYTSGLRFAHALLVRGGYPSVDGAFRRYPSSTEEILHPEKYFRGKSDFREYSSEEVGTELGGQVSSFDRLGEFFISALLGQYLSDRRLAADAASGWGGDGVVIRKNIIGGKDAVVWRLHWDTVRDAEEFHLAFQQLLKSRFAISQFPGGEAWIEGNGGKKIQLRQQGQDVVFAMKF
jgi:hypothetical protein